MGPACDAARPVLSVPRSHRPRPAQGRRVVRDPDPRKHAPNLWKGASLRVGSPRQHAVVPAETLPAGRRISSTSWLLDPLDPVLSGSATGSASATLNITRISEDAEYPFETQGERRANPHAATQEGHPIDGDAIYCAGHTTLQDGRVFFVGGARYAYTSSEQEREYGLDYVRLYDPATNSFTRFSASRMPLGRSWYPTAGRLPDGARHGDGRVLRLFHRCLCWHLMPQSTDQCF